MHETFWQPSGGNIDASTIKNLVEYKRSTPHQQLFKMITGWGNFQYPENKFHPRFPRGSGTTTALLCAAVHNAYHHQLEIAFVTPFPADAKRNLRQIITVDPSHPPFNSITILAYSEIRSTYVGRRTGVDQFLIDESSSMNIDYTLLHSSLKRTLYHPRRFPRIITCN